MKLTFDEAVKYHRNMWNYIAGEYEKQISSGSHYLTDIGHMKIDFTNKYFPGEQIKNECFCCEYASYFIPTYECRTGCSSYYRHCPLKWGSFEPYMCEKYIKDNPYPYPTLIRYTGPTNYFDKSEDMRFLVDACLAIANLDINEDARE